MLLSNITMVKLVILAISERESDRERAPSATQTESIRLAVATSDIQGHLSSYPKHLYIIELK